ncbi:unnamed protein product [Mytilus coruscus]|uniref:C2H2-type domain-containing protein n=1 Tax=Mytilus coruscus TaxID=42192 RepID=A0A6J8CF08_MYTCO|nr:unnamed protein product [Mytilus coruscus]
MESKVLVLKYHRHSKQHEMYECDICGKKFGRKYNLERHLLRHKDNSLFQYKNNDEICCARALVTAKANIVKHPKSEDIRKGRLIQKQLAIELHDKANIPLKTCNLEDITQFQRAMNAYQIHVVSQQHFNGIIFQGPEAERKIYLYHHNEHYDVITSMPGFSNRSYYCNICQKGYQNKEEHKCNNICTSCHKINEIENKEWIYCKDCNRFFQGDVCIQLHAKKTSQ